MKLTKNIPYGMHELDELDIQAVVEILKTNQITQGQTVEKFGQALADYTGAKYGLALSSGTAALHTSVVALDIGPGDEVITSPMTFCATANAALYQGATVKFVDIDEKSLNIDPNLLEKNITKKTRAIIPIDFRGHPANLPDIKKIADMHSLVIIEDGSPFIYPIFVESSKLKTDKITFANALIAEGIPLNPHYMYLVRDWNWVKKYLADDNFFYGQTLCDIWYLDQVRKIVVS